MKADSSKRSLASRLSTDHPETSSASRPIFPLAKSLFFAFVLSAIALAQGNHLESRPLPASTVGERLAADLTWTQAERDSRFRHMDRIFPTHVVQRGGNVRPLSAGPSLRIPAEAITRYMQAEHLAGVLVLQNGQIRAEQYALGMTAGSLWTSFSVTKAVTDTLAGAALKTGALHSLDDDVTRYLPEMRGSAYDGVTVRQLMTMTSGVRWNENYTSAGADNVRLYTTPVAPGRNSTVEYMRTLQRETAPGTRWQYNTGETDLLGVLLHRATGKTLARQLSETIWRQAGMEHDATWIASSPGSDGEEFGGSGLSATLRDFGRLGQWVLEGGHGAVDPGWFTEATRPQVKAGGAAYGYGWWPQPDGSFAALGIFGQSILVDPQRQMVIVTLGDWDTAVGAAHSQARAAFWHQVKATLDSEASDSAERRR